jgi:hypothetical protein
VVQVPTFPIHPGSTWYLSQIDEAEFACQALSLAVTLGHSHGPAAHRMGVRAEAHPIGRGPTRARARAKVRLSQSSVWAGRMKAGPHWNLYVSLPSGRHHVYHVIIISIIRLQTSIQYLNSYCFCSHCR